jgi:hypothetical protein
VTRVRKSSKKRYIVAPLVYAVNLHNPNLDTLLDTDSNVRDYPILLDMGASALDVGFRAKEILHDEAGNSSHGNPRLERNLTQLLERLLRKNVANIA